jgi:hypothetical protein
MPYINLCPKCKKPVRFDGSVGMHIIPVAEQPGYNYQEPFCPNCDRYWHKKDLTTKYEPDINKATPL